MTANLEPGTTPRSAAPPSITTTLKSWITWETLVFRLGGERRASWSALSWRRAALFTTSCSVSATMASCFPCSACLTTSNCLDSSSSPLILSAMAWILSISLLLDCNSAKAVCCVWRSDFLASLAEANSWFFTSSSSFSLVKALMSFVRASFFTRKSTYFVFSSVNSPRRPFRFL